VARLDDSNVKTSLDVAQAQLESAQAALAETARNSSRPTRNFSARPNWPNRTSRRNPTWTWRSRMRNRLQAHLARQELDVVVAERQVEMWQQQMDDMIIRAPFDGVITTKDAQPGEMISPVSAGGGFTRTGIGTIVDMNSLEIEIDVNESYINRVEPGQPVEATLDAYPDWKIPCKVIAIIPTADRAKVHGQGARRFRQAGSAHPAGHVGEGGLPRNGRGGGPHGDRSQERGAQPDGRDVVFVVQDGHAERRAVTVSDTQNDDSVLSAGVSAGEKVIVDAPAGFEGRHGGEGKNYERKQIQRLRLVHVEGVEKVFHRGSEDIHVLADLSLQVPAGEFLA
jgi:multidrug efflux pump subunit AcrA (membrane-fusion protein)